MLALTRRLTFALSALEALIAVCVGLVSTLLPLTIVWLFESGGSIDWLVTLRGSIDVWLLSHGTRLVIPESTLGSAEIPQFVVSLVPLGMAALTLYLGIRAGRKLSGAEALWPGWAGGTLTYGLASFALTLIAYTPTAYPVSWQGTLLPPTVFFLAMATASLVSQPSVFATGQEAPERVWMRNWTTARFERMQWAVRVLLNPALRAGTAITVMLLLVSSTGISILIGVNWIEITRLYEGVQVSILGGIIVTLGQLALLPNLIVYGAAWLTGVGFSIGTGSLISPLGSQLGPLPALPILGALPVGELSFGMIAILVPLLASLIATVAIKRHTAEIRYEYATPLSAALALGVAIGFVTAIELALLAAIASGSLGPGRLASIGINPWMVALVSFIEVSAMATLAAFYSARPDRADHELLNNRSR